MPENFLFLTVSSPWSLLMTSDNEPLLFHPCYMKFPSYWKFLINHIIALDKGFRTHKTSKKHASIYKSTEAKITVIKPLLILNHRHPLSLLITAGKPLSYFLYLHLCIPWASSSTSHNKTRQEEKGVSQSQCYAPCRTHALLTGRVRALISWVHRSAGCCPSALPHQVLCSQVGRFG